MGSPTASLLALLVTGCVVTPEPRDPCGAGCGANARCERGACVCEDGYADCDGRPGCEASVSSDPRHCGACDVACGGAAPSCLGGACGACESDEDCPADGPPCLSAPSCVEGACERAPIEGTCLIDGVCRAEGERLEGAPCFECRPSASASSWTRRSDPSCLPPEPAPFGEPITTELWRFDRMALADVDGDGLADLVTGSEGSPMLIAYRSLGDGTFEEAQRVAL